MKKVRYIFTVIWEGLFVLNFLFWQLVFYWPLYFLFSRESRWKAAMKVQRFWAGWLRVTMGLRTEITYDAPLDPRAVYIYTPNHANFLDILVAYKFIPNYYHFMAKGSLAKVPLFRLMFWKTHIPFERSSKTESNQAFHRACADLRKGYSILVYPEGTQNPRRGTLLPFKSGAFRMAVQEQIPVIPVTCYNNLDRMPHQRELFKLRPGGPGKIHIRVGTPLHPADYDNDPALLMEKVQATLQENLNQYYTPRKKG